MTTPACTCEALTPAWAGDWRHGLYLFGHRRGCPQRVSHSLPGRFLYARPLAEPRTLPVAKRRERRLPGKPR